MRHVDTPEPRPHLLHVSLRVLDHGWGTDERIECPYDDLGADRPCAVMEECVEHPLPPAPPEPEPQHTWYLGHRSYAEGSDAALVTRWQAYWSQIDAYDTEHPHGPFHPRSECWVAQEVHEGDIEDVVMEDFPDSLEIQSPIPVGWRNAGDTEMSELVLVYWKGADAAEHA